MHLELLEVKLCMQTLVRYEPVVASVQSLMGAI